MARAQIEIDRTNVKVRDIAIRPGHIEIEIIPKSKDPDKPMRQWKSRGLHLGLWDKELVVHICDLFLHTDNHETAIYESIDVVFDWFKSGVKFEISSAESPHDFDVSKIEFGDPEANRLADSR